MHLDDFTHLGFVDGLATDLEFALDLQPFGKDLGRGRRVEAAFGEAVEQYQAALILEAHAGRLVADVRLAEQPLDRKRLRACGE